MAAVAINVSSEKKIWIRIQRFLYTFFNIIVIKIKGNSPFFPPQDLTGDIVTCAGSWLYVWDIAGRPLSSIDTNRICPPLSPQPKQQQILCLAFSQMNEWDRENVIMSG